LTLGPAIYPACVYFLASAFVKNWLSTVDVTSRRDSVGRQEESFAFWRREALSQTVASGLVAEEFTPSNPVNEVIREQRHLPAWWPKRVVPRHTVESFP